MKTWWSGLSGREQRLVSLAGGALLLALLYWGAWQPFMDRLEQERLRVASQQQTLDWMQAQGQLLQRLQGSLGRRPDLSMPLDAVVSQTAGQFQLQITRRQPSGQQLQLEMDQADFNQLLSWLKQLEQAFGVRVQLMELSALDERQGQVRVRRLLLGRAS